MKTIRLLLLTAIFPTVLLSGCGDKMELDQLAIVVAMGIDQVEDSDDIEVSFQIINPHGASARVATEGGGGEDASVYTFTTRGKTIVEALDKAKNITPRRLFFSHIYYLVIGESFARETGISRLFDFVERDEQMRMEFLAFIAKEETARNILRTFTPLDENPAKSVRDRVLVASGSLGIKKNISLSDALRAYVSDNEHPIILGLRNISSEDSSETDVLHRIDEHSFSLDGLAVFENDRLKDWFTTEESQGWVFLNGMVGDRTVFDTPCEGGYAGVRLHKLTQSTNASVKDGRPVFEISLDGTGYLLETTCTLDLTDPDDMEALKEAVSNELEKEIRSTIEKTRTLGFDATGLSGVFRDHHPDKWQEWKDSWFGHFMEAEFIYNINVDINLTGMRYNAADEE
ncbi:Ger(x)C family spore germination protein [Alteribacter natronophilus]|uniref:Ger(x)C family spore germination protein n=1 Tax=Alteribacter natronophilus TaxID=2583810 RepID=UPI00110E02EA|nr:Ger(x)C family spore germination protein [Alteribacter natronophilus]TMW72964.1 Ger(x)C family spore germination protein [Alteribacter natronophilus]